MVKQHKRREKNLGDADIESIVGILDGWTGRLSWEALIEKVYFRSKARYTRQALFRHTRIREAFQLTKARARANEGKPSRCAEQLSLAEVQALVERFSKLEAENERLLAENERLLGQFVLWAYNAHTKGLSLDFLNRPLPRIDRRQTRPGKTSAEA